MSEEISLLMKSSNWVARRAEMRGGVNQLRDPHYRNIRPLRHTQNLQKNGWAAGLTGQHVSRNEFDPR